MLHGSRAFEKTLIAIESKFSGIFAVDKESAKIFRFYGSGQPLNLNKNMFENGIIKRLISPRFL